ncbi:hypothetical protein [Noviherbaspirillum sp. Root189]|uniref:hypothetical protein n=1 Tax=Noviherbaspirillum sp. Root189 TaxID=1736487 RepID=UPI0012E3F20D|nr:hypothetical protein [Noviherbaspirillum sp. Root189]
MALVSGTMVIKAGSSLQTNFEETFIGKLTNPHTRMVCGIFGWSACVIVLATSGFSCRQADQYCTEQCLSEYLRIPRTVGELKFPRFSLVESNT